MHIKSKYSWLKHADFIMIDLLSLIMAFVFSYKIKFGSLKQILSNKWLGLMIIVIFTDLLITLLVNPYSGILRRSFYEQIAKTGSLALYNFIVSCVLFYIMKIGVSFSREMLIQMYVCYFILALFLEYIWKKMLVGGVIHTKAMAPIRLFVIAPSDRLSDIVRNSESGDFNQYEIAGSCSEAHIGDFADYVIQNNISEVLIAGNPQLIPSNILKRLIENGVGLHIDVESLLGFKTEEQQVSRVGVNRTLSVGTFSFTPKQIFFFGVKRIFDIFCGLLGCGILLPIAAGVKIAYLISGDRAPIIYKQNRVGKNGNIIHIYKFRSMVPDADKKLAELLKNETYRKEWEQNQKLQNDPRITRVGNFLRKASLDEFPQFINVLKGDMSLVGPRPLIEGELEAHGGLKLYNRVKPGITGWWACNGRSNIDYNERLELEYHYVRHFSLYLDLLCIFRTVVAVFKRDGAK